MSTSSVQMIASSLLMYPDENFQQRRDALRAMSKVIDGPAGESLRRFFAAIDEMTLDEIQKHYVEIFDMRRRCSLFLTSWTHGDTRNRGMALLHFKEIYKAVGITMSDEELPDHLAVVLEFAALMDHEEGNLLLGEHRAPIELIRDALHHCNSFYASILDAVVATLPAMTPEIEARARALALSGPPQEFVGLSGAVSIALEPFSSNPALVADGVRT
ncbi:MAG: nitrate reductase molybdenum cofactor assembly chaperone [Candidatus Nanopelagicaceae bacterium]|nr:nitrate reductase molybdenum cofactor assembly chaperone [Candidatus Nanopelagicaceae bacterium]